MPITEIEEIDGDYELLSSDEIEEYFKEKENRKNEK